MSFSLYDACVPPMVHMLENLAKILGKAETQATANKIPPASLLKARLAADMFSFTRQVQFATDIATDCAARLTGAPPPAFSDEEKTFAELQDRIRKTIAYLQSLAAETFVGAEDRTVSIIRHGLAHEFSGRVFVCNYALPDFYFCVTAAYALLRLKDIEIGKHDYLGR
jgi:uncharacterized protein